MQSEKYCYTDLQQIANGAFGIVSRAVQRDILNQKPIQTVAIKQVSYKEQTDRNPIGADPDLEIQQMQNCTNQNVIRLLDSFADENYTYIIMQYHPVSLQNIMFPQLPLRVVQTIMHQVFCGINAINSRHTAHRDIKPSNIMISRTGVLQIADFGQATSDFEQTNNCGTRIYRAPESLLSAKFNEKVDVFSAGLIVFELVAGRPLFTASSEIELITQQNAILGPFEGVLALEQSADWPKILLESGWEKGEKLREILQNVSDDSDFKELILGCLDCDSETRWTAEMCMDSNFCAKRGQGSLIQRFLYYQDANSVNGRILGGVD
ncbi:Kinase, CMGC CDK [Spironucleus salmonicida]|uniref:Kinase, CMGC CDK n=1 Tax=Spironucleus salmonicida TaxID=348837 RepID=V6LJW2_9EUKA|nr:Kinase, CMGC CDK [Spironucleus salmonicida]|eukprot:EST44653.1 Kinase, CMGC CDK [Spironucleus salmonicida]